MTTMNTLLEAKASLIHDSLSRVIEGQHVVNCSEMAKKLVLAEEKIRRQYIENTRKTKMRVFYKLDEQKLQSDFRLLKFIGYELFAQTLPGHMTKAEFVDFVITVYGSGRDRGVTQRLFQLIDTQGTGRVSQLDVAIYCEPILTAAMMNEVFSFPNRVVTFEQFRRLNITNFYK